MNSKAEARTGILAFSIVLVLAGFAVIIVMALLAVAYRKSMILNRMKGAGKEFAYLSLTLVTDVAL